MKYIAILFLLCACSKTEPSTALIKTTQESIKATQETVKSLDKIITPECKTTAINSILSDVNTRLSTLNKEVENIGLACKTEKDVLKEENSKLKIIITFLLIISCGLIYLLAKKTITKIA